MPRSCSLCARTDVGEINDRLQAGDSLRVVALKFGVAKSVVYRHSQRHASTSLPGATTAAGPLEELVAALRARALAGSDVAAREYRLALHDQAAARHATGEVVALQTTDEWLRLRARLLAALAAFPEARRAVADALADA